MTRDCWDDFVVSGRVSDYLKYREQEQRGGQRENTAAWTGGKANGAYDRPDGHGAVGNAGR